jgi:hypothetical protein
MKNNIFERNIIKTIIFFLLIFTCVLDVMLTTAYNFYKKGEKETNNIYTPHPVFYQGLKMSFKSEVSDILGPYSIYSNSLGFRDKASRNILLKSESHRILFMGDSFTEGILLNYEDTFVGIIDSKLSTKPIEVLNAGVQGYSPIIYWRKLKYLIEEVGLKINEVVVFIDFSDPINELAYKLNDDLTIATIPKNAQGLQNTSKPKSFLVSIKHFIFFNTSLLYPVLNFLYDSVGFFGQQGDEWSYLLSGHPYHKWSLDEKKYNRHAKDGVLSMKKYMAKLLKLLDKNGVELTIAVYPWPVHIWHEDLDSRHAKIWEEWSLNENVRFINYFPDIVEQNINKDKKVEILKKYYIPGDVHFNRGGNKLIAEKFLKIYQNNTAQ